MGILAMHGGRPARREPFIAWPVHGTEEKEQVEKVVESGNWWQFAYEGSTLEQGQVAGFQRDFAAYHRAAHAICCANGTAALEVLLKAAGVGPGDEVIVPSYTFVSSATAVLMNQARPVFADIDPETYNIDPARVEEAISPRTKAIMPVHFAGQCCDMDAIGGIAARHGVQIVEDCAHAHGAEWKGSRCGTFGTGGTFSFQASKAMTAGEGGLITTNDSQVKRLCDSYIRLGREQGRPWYEFHRLGWNYRITEFQGAILRVQLTRLDQQIETRNRNFRYLQDCLKDIEGLRPARDLAGANRHTRHLVLMRFDEALFGFDKSRFCAALNAEGLLTQTGYMFPIYQNPLFKNLDPAYAAYESSNPACERACRQEAVWLDHRMFLGTRDDVDDVVAAIRKVIAHSGELKK